MLDNSYKTHKFSKTLEDLYPLFQKWRDTNIEELIPQVIEHYMDYKEASALNAAITEEAKLVIKKECQEEREELSVLVSIASKFTSLFEFLDSFILDSSREEDDEDAVVISTIHSAKGLEWDTVFILDVVDGFTPMVNFMNCADPEELRCFYVALTRPKRHLYLMRPVSICRFGKNEVGKTSRYLRFCEKYYDELDMSYPMRAIS